MTKKLLLTIALGDALAVIAAGTATSVTVDLGNGAGQVPTGGALPACADLTDNDGDGADRPRRPGLQRPARHRRVQRRPAPAPDPARRPPAAARGAGAPRHRPAPGQGHAQARARSKGRAPGGGIFGRSPQGRQGRSKAEREKIEEPADPQPRRLPHQRNPGPHHRPVRPGPDRRPQLRHRPVRDPALPAADLPGLRHRVRDPLAGARLDQPDRDRLRDQPQRLLRRRDGLDAVHPSSLAGLRNRRQRRRPQGSVQPRRRDLRRRPLPQGRRRRGDLRDAIFAYNHADWYVDEVLLYANEYAKLPDDLVGSLTGLTEGAHFPVAADARYADDISEREALQRSKTAAPTAGNAADVISRLPDPPRHQHLLEG